MRILPWSKTSATDSAAASPYIKRALNLGFAATPPHCRPLRARCTCIEETNPRRHRVNQREDLAERMNLPDCQDTGHHGLGSGIYIGMQLGQLAAENLGKNLQARAENLPHLDKCESRGRDGAEPLVDADHSVMQRILLRPCRRLELTAADFYQPC